MKKRTLPVRALPSGVTALAFAICSAAIGHEVPSEEQVKVEAGKTVTVRQETFRNGLHTETVQLSQSVSFADLDLTTPSGAAELRKRVRNTANTLCKLLRDVGPPNSELNEERERRACVDGAAGVSMSKVKRMMASAEEGNRRG